MRATLDRNSNDGLLYIVRQDKTAYPAEIHQGNVLKIRESYTVLNNETEYDLVPIIGVKDGTATFLLKERVIKPKGPFGQEAGAGGGGGSGKGIYVEKDGTQVGGIMKRLNFIGQLVTVADAGGQEASITIKIPSMTTAARLALVPTTALIVEDTDLDMYFKWSTVTSSWNPF